MPNAKFCNAAKYISELSASFSGFEQGTMPLPLRSYLDVTRFRGIFCSEIERKRYTKRQSIGLLRVKQFTYW